MLRAKFELGSLGLQAGVLPIEPSLYVINEIKFCRAWKKTQFCPECNVCFGREHIRRIMDKNMDWKGAVGALKYSGCWVCGRQHHSHCVANPDLFICAACQKRTLEKSIGSGNFAALSVASLAGSGPGDRASFAQNPITTTPYSSRSRRNWARTTPTTFGPCEQSYLF